jgi:hypothetical protein
MSILFADVAGPALHCYKAFHEIEHQDHKRSLAHTPRANYGPGSAAYLKHAGPGRSACAEFPLGTHADIPK